MSNINDQFFSELVMGDTLKTGFANPAALGSSAVIAAVPGKRIKVVGMVVISTLANNVNFLSAATSISATFPLAATGGFILPYNNAGWAKTAVGEALNVNMTVATPTGVHVLYEEI